MITPITPGPRAEERRGPRVSVDDETLVSLIGVSVLAVDGVTRLEPTLTSLFRVQSPGSSRGLPVPTAYGSPASARSAT